MDNGRRIMEWADHHGTGVVVGHRLGFYVSDVRFLEEISALSDNARRGTTVLIHLSGVEKPITFLGTLEEAYGFLNGPA